MLIKYLRNVYEAEKDKFLLQQLIQAEGNKMRNIDREINKLVEKKKENVVLESLPALKTAPTSYDFVGYFVGGLLPGGVAGGVVAFGAMLFADRGWSWNLFWGVAICVAFLMAIAVNSSVKDDYDKYLKNVNDTQKRNARVIKKHDTQIAESDKKIETLNHIKHQCHKNIQILNSKCKEVESVLKRYYDLEIIFVKYHHMAAVSKMLEYLQSGRCNTLYGPSGAYDTYEKEYRTDTIIDRLDKIISKIDEIKRTNIMLYQAVQQVSASVERVHLGMREQFQSLESNLGKSIGLLEQNVEANKTLAEITNTSSRNLSELVEYQNFAIKQQRLNDGRWS